MKPQEKRRAGSFFECAEEFISSSSCSTSPRGEYFARGEILVRARLPRQVPWLAADGVSSAGLKISVALASRTAISRRGRMTADGRFGTAYFARPTRCRQDATPGRKSRAITQIKPRGVAT